MSEVAPGVGWLSDVSEGNCGGVIREMGWVWAGGYGDVQEEYYFYMFIHNLISPAMSSSRAKFAPTATQRCSTGCDRITTRLSTFRVNKY